MSDSNIKKRIPIKITLPADVYEWLLKRAMKNERSRGAEMGQILRTVMTQEATSASPTSV